MEQVLLVAQVIITLGLIIMVLIQRSDSDGFGLSGGSGNNLLSGRSTANLMTRTTAILAALFMANALLLGVIAARSHSASIVDTIQEQQANENAAPSVPAAGETKTEKKVEKKPEVKTAPAVPAAGADAKPVKAAKKPVEKTDETDPNTANTNE